MLERKCGLSTWVSQATRDELDRIAIRRGEATSRVVRSIIERALRREAPEP